MTTRERKIKFMSDGGRDTLREAVADMIRSKGADWLTDDQLSDLVSKYVADWRFTQHFNMRNRQKGTRS